MRLNLVGVSHSYGTSVVLNQVDLQFEPGQSVALVGPSGVGKSTLLAIAGGLLIPDEGEVEITTTEQVSKPVTKVRNDIGWIFQTTNAFGNRSGLNNVVGHLRLRGWDRSEAEQRTRSLAEELQILDVIHKPVRTMSGGERQRLGIIRALSDRPEILLADEPTGQLDDQSSKAVVRSIVHNRPAGGLCIIVTHDPAVAAECHRQVEMPFS